MSLKDKTIVVTGGSRGLGLGLVEALVDQGTKVTVVARDQAALAAVEQRLGVAVIPADVTDEGAAQRILADVRPEVLVRREAVDTAVSRFVELPTVQRSVVILKDVLDQSLEEIAAMLDLTVNAVKGHLARGRARLKAINAQAPAQPAPRPPSPAVARYVALFNRRDWDGLRAMLADDACG